jgi:hypothetical protein
MKARLIACIGVLFLGVVPILAQPIAESKLKAILIVGHQEDGTQNAMEEMDKVAKLFEQQSISVFRFYDKAANWKDIVHAARDCQFLVYSGHGSVMGENGNAGGLCIKTMVSSAQLTNELKLKDNALVLFQSVCYGAGSSASDLKDIGIVEAKKRVTHYATPFFEVGAAAYVANNYSDGILNFLEDFLDGMDLKTAYESQAESWSEIIFNHPFPGYSDKMYSIAADEGGGIGILTTYTNGKKTQKEIVSPRSYDVAYVGPPEFTIHTIRATMSQNGKAKKLGADKSRSN